MNFTELRLKVRRFLRNNRRLIIVVLIVWAIIFLVNFIFKHRPEVLTPSTTYTMHTSVLDSTSSVPSQLSAQIEELISKYVEACNDGNYQKAFDMLSDECKEYAFNNDIQEFMRHVLTKMPTPKRYAVQDYSNTKFGKKTVYIYEVKFTDDLLATGLTGADYRYTTDKFMFSKNGDELEMNVGDYMYHEDIKAISENEYLKIDIVDKVVNYSIETYKVKLTNKSQYTVVLSDGAEADEIVLNLPNEYRTRSEVDNIVLLPGETQEVVMTFKKFADDGDDSLSLTFALVRVMEKYSGTDGVSEETVQNEIDNAISKFSMSVNV